MGYLKFKHTPGCAKVAEIIRSLIREYSPGTNSVNVDNGSIDGQFLCSHYGNVYRVTVEFCPQLSGRGLDPTIRRMLHLAVRDVQPAEALWNILTKVRNGDNSA